MQFKTIDQKFEWQKRGAYPMRCVVWILDYFTNLFFNIDITVTSAIRPKKEGKPSFHPKGQALDFRTKDLPSGVVKLWILVIWFINRTRKGFKDFKGKFTWVMEDKDKDNEHFHLQLRKGDPV